MRVCPSGQTCGHAQDSCSVLESPGIQAMSVTLLLVEFVPSYFTWRWWREKGKQKTSAQYGI
jgi:hypothetical protein